MPEAESRLSGDWTPLQFRACGKRLLFRTMAYVTVGVVPRLFAHLTPAPSSVSKRNAALPPALTAPANATKAKTTPTARQKRYNSIPTPSPDIRAASRAANNPHLIDCWRAPRAMSESPNSDAKLEEVVARARPFPSGSSVTV